MVKCAFTMLAANERKLIGMDLMQVIDFCRYLPTMRRYGKQTVHKALSMKLNDRYLAPMRDLTQFDWQLNKKLHKQYKEHLEKRMRKRVSVAEADSEIVDVEVDESESQQLTLPGMNDSESALSASISVSMSESSSLMY